ncbi:MarR family winged helix-turn-helix transcriptional regulator [Paucilactobacillus wasatchensis]|uniref:Transcriptional regulator, MarR family n=1 Tax=Paucilactobacillus wasatchensis TaxID=1335616 RepID=A0A0D1AC92_9LACO|nr:MarR family winged helix-turn-helix transcriptional regulator [Paucilactobacillus wasatchensis]KIS04291.1 Transcriptional regulator, MarR family [Paucilactobacillus wasatchensis]
MTKNTGRLLKMAANQLTKKFDQFAAQFNLTGTQMSIIDFLSRHPNTEVTQKDIELEFNIRRSTATVLLQRMERKQLLFRSASTTDARQKTVHLTKSNNKLVSAITAYMDQQQRALTTKFSVPEVAAFETMLNYYLNANQGGE